MVIFLTCISLPDRLHKDQSIIDLDVFFLPTASAHLSSQVPIYTECVNKLLFATPWTVQSVGFSRPEHWSGYPFPSPGALPNSGVEPRSPTLQADSLPAEPPGKPYDTKSKVYSRKIFPLKSSVEFSCLILLEFYIYILLFSEALLTL